MSAGNPVGRLRTQAARAARLHRLRHENAFHVDVPQIAFGLLAGTAALVIGVMGRSGLVAGFGAMLLLGAGLAIRAPRARRGTAP